MWQFWFFNLFKRPEYLSSEGVDFKYFLVGGDLKNSWTPFLSPCLVLQFEHTVVWQLCYSTLTECVYKYLVTKVSFAIFLPFDEQIHGWLKGVGAWILWSSFPSLQVRSSKPKELTWFVGYKTRYSQIQGTWPSWFQQASLFHLLFFFYCVEVCLLFFPELKYSVTQGEAKLKGVQLH